MIKQPIRNRQRIKEEPQWRFSRDLDAPGRSKSAVFFRWIFEGYLSKVKSFTRSQEDMLRKQNKGLPLFTTIKKEGYTRQRRLLLFLVQYLKNKLVFLTQSYDSKVAERKFYSLCSEITKGNFKNQGLA